MHTSLSLYMYIYIYIYIYIERERERYPSDADRTLGLAEPDVYQGGTTCLRLPAACLTNIINDKQHTHNAQTSNNTNDVLTESRE